MKAHTNIIKSSLRLITLALMAVAGISTISAQSSLPAPGSGGSFQPAPVGPPPVAPGIPGSPLGPGAPGGPLGPGYIGPNGAFMNGPNWQNEGVITVMGCGYNVYGDWTTIPMKVSYEYNGMQYEVTVLSAWEPSMQMWNTGIDTPAYNTTYYTHGNTYNFYVVLASGTYYFNL
ncbi:MAG: hypothetical protein K2K26_08250 [Muribaculaceae bacterium]|nr:hypothetical protein [Muribaculaceae bacterium]